MTADNKKVAIIDYGLGNLYSIKKALDYFTKEWVITSDPFVILKAKAVVLPGVGAFKAGMDGLRERGLIECLRNFAASNRPILGICLGAQMLLTEGHEFGVHQGLDIIKGQVVKFPELKPNAKIPHIGWNKIMQAENTSWDKSILDGIKNDSNMYFVHSYILQPDKIDDIFTLTKYEGYKFCSAVKKGKVYGCQFHPEKSGKIGLKIIKNFINLI